MQRSDQDVLKDGRKNALTDVEVPLKERQIKKLAMKLDDMGEGANTVQIWNQANSDRTKWLVRQQELAFEFDEFIDPIYSKSQDWMSTMHLPITLTACKTLHARLFAALMGIDPPFTVNSRQAANEDRAPLIQDLMRYSLASYTNNYKGIEETVDAWIWRWITQGSGILKQRWERKYERYYDVVEKDMPDGSVDSIDPQTGQNVTTNNTKKQEVEEEVTHKVFDGPMMEEIPNEDIVLVGGKGDPHEADDVIHSTMMTASELWQLSDQGIFSETAVEEVIKSGDNAITSDPASNIKLDRAYAAGTTTIDKSYDIPRYQILERYSRLDVDGSGITSEVIIWVHKETNKILRATYLRRIMKSGLRPFAKIDFYKRHGQDNGVGLPELLYTLSKECDMIHNLRMDVGIQTSLPYGFFRPTNSTSDERLSYGPGQLIPLDNPQTDVYFPNLGNRTAFTFQEEAALMTQIERLTSIGDLALGVNRGQGATRTATGTRALLGEGSQNLDIFVRRMNRGWRQVLNYHFHMLQEKIPPNFTFRVFGDDGQNYFRTIQTHEEICGNYDFELEPNSANSNKQIQIEQANQIYQMSGNMLDVQLGIITPLERYEAAKHLLQVQGVRNFSRFIRKPQNALRVFTPEELANRVLAGVDAPIGPEQDLKGFVDYVEHVIDNDDLLGQFSQQQTITLAKKYQEAKQMMAAVQSQASQNANQQQIATNAAMSTGAAQPTPQGATQPNNPAAGK